MQTPPAKDYAATSKLGNIINLSPGNNYTDPSETGRLNCFSVGARPAVVPFFQSLSPCYQQPLANNDKSVSYDARPAALTGQSVLK